MVEINRSLTGAQFANIQVMTVLADVALLSVLDLFVVYLTPAGISVISSIGLATDCDP